MSEFHKNKVSEIEEMFAIGNPIFLKFFELKDAELKEKLKDIIGDHGLFGHLYEKNSLVKRVIKNEVPDTIEIWDFDHIEISCFGIYYTPEHGQTKKLIAFNKHFKF